MDWLLEILFQIVLFLTVGVGLSWVFWKLTGSKMSFADFLAKYGELLGYFGAILLAILIIYLMN